MAFTVTFVFDGLFVFVQRQNASTGKPLGLHVLLAKTSGGPHHKHTSTIEIDGVVKNFSGEADWTTNLKSGAKSMKLEGVLPLSRTTGLAVDEALLSSQFASVSSKLEGRIRLPLPTAQEPLSETVEVEWQPEGSPPPARENLGPMTGRIALTYQATAPVKIGTFADIVSQTVVTIRHLPAPVSGQAHHKKGDPLGHSHMNKPIFAGAAPRFYILHDHDGPVYPAAQDPGQPLTIFGVDPVICTAGGGCPPEDPKCGEG